MSDTEAYEPITNSEFLKRLESKLEDMTGLELVQAMPDLVSNANEHFNNEILEDYESENDHYLTEEQCLSSYLDGRTFEAMRVKFQYDDIALREDYNNYTDMLCKDGTISEYLYNIMDNPF